MSTQKKDTPFFQPQYLKYDLMSGFILFLIALPLSVGISLASGAPATAGIFAAIVGGLIGSLLGNSALNINGPAAGLIIVILGAIGEIGATFPAANAFQLMLTAIFLAGMIQVIFGLLKFGRFALYFPEPVIQGMLSAIGFIIIIKQIPQALGVIPKEKEIFHMILQLPQYIHNANLVIVTITLPCLMLLMIYPRLLAVRALAFLKYFPAPLMAIILGTVLGKYFQLDVEHVKTFLGHDYHMLPNFLLNVPANMLEGIIHPDFSQILHPIILKWAFIIALIASIESVLSCVAVDKLDPEKRRTNLSRDIWSKGICNMVLGLIGGLPIISEIVRSTANIQQQAKSRFSNFFHGLFILLFVLFFPFVLKMIPMGPLAAVLIMVGFRLAHPSNFKKAYHHGKLHFTSFIITLVLTVIVDLLVGILSGALFELIVYVLSTFVRSKKSSI